MILDLIWGAGEVISIVALLYGGYLVLMETETLSSLLGKRSSASLLLSRRDLRLIQGFAGYDADVRLSANRVMDEEHRGLFVDVENLRSALLSGRCAGEVNAIIEGLFRDLVHHFEDEEAILADADHPGMARHRALHRELSDSAATLIGQFRAGRLSVGELFRFLAHEVVAKHMLTADLELIPCFEKQS